MLTSLFFSVIFAQQEGAPAPGGELYKMLLPGVIIIAMFYFMLIRPNQKKEQERRKMLAGLRKNDHVVTVGGIKGVVAHVKPDENEVILKIDEATGAKLRVELTHITRVIASDESASSEKGEKKES
jgi:preprotein translocase subunit YajC